MRMRVISVGRHALWPASADRSLPPPSGGGEQIGDSWHLSRLQPGFGADATFRGWHGTLQDCHAHPG